MSPRDPFRAYLFAVEIGGVQRSRFQKATFPKSKTEQIPLPNGGTNADKKVPGKTTWEDIDLEFQAEPDAELAAWRAQIQAQNDSGSSVPDEYKRDIDEVQYGPDGEELERWTLHGAWPSADDAGEGDATKKAEMRMRKYTFTYDWAERTYLKT